jgi:hypothetical protein
MSINEKFYIYLYKRNNKLTDKQNTEENNHTNFLFDTNIET